MVRFRFLLVPTLTLLFSVAARLGAQPMVKCGADLSMHQSLSGLGRNMTCIATFDVIRDTPTNLAISLSDSTAGAGLFIGQTRENIQRLAFAHDTFGVRLVFQFILDEHITAHYTRFIGTDTIMIVTPVTPPKVQPCLVESRSIDMEKGTITLEGNVFTQDSVPTQSKILVERFFSASSHPSMILENNCPQLDAEIRMASDLYDRERFRGAVRELDDETFGKLRLLIHFRVVRRRKGATQYTVF